MIVCMSRRICVDLYNALIELRPDWASVRDDDIEAEKDKHCVVKVVMTGSAEDGPDWQPHIRGKEQRRKLANRFKDSKDPFRIVIVRDMWLTGFDAPCLTTMYADKPMQGHGLMQAIARVNRVFRDKPGGLVVDYLGLADQFLAEVRGLKHKNVAAELLEKLLKDEIKVRAQHNVVQSALFSDKLKKTLNAYHNRAISTLEVIEELITLGKEINAATRRGQDLGLSDDEVAFYDALAANDSVVQAMGDDKLKLIAAELITQVRKSVTIDWTLREGARAKIRVMVKRILNKYGYPPDLQQEAVKTVLRLAELLSAMWAIA